MSEQVFKGIVASHGLGIGKVLLKRSDVIADSASQGTAEEERALFNQAIQQSLVDLSHLMASQDDTGANIIEFQLALLEDDDLLLPVIQSIADGTAAQSAWMDMMNAEVSEFSSASDAYMAARAEDYADLQSRVASALAGDTSTLDLAACGSQVVIIADQLAPSQVLVLETKYLAGIALTGGAPSSHASILARARGIPMLVGCDAGILDQHDGDVVLLDASTSCVYVNPSEDRYTEFEKKIENTLAIQETMNASADRPAYSLNGQRIHVHANVDDPVLLETTDVRSFDGIGLTRTECIYQESVLPDEHEQYDIYRGLLQWANGKPVTIRTLDAGGDKPIKDVTFDDEKNPFLGVRGYRLSLLRSDIFNTQLRALARAAVHGPLKVMIPMVTKPSEMSEFRSTFHEVVRSLESEGIACSTPQLGMMIEVPAAALCAEDFDTDFFSIGTNDLIQYTLAVARDNPRLSELVTGSHKATLRLIKFVVDAAKDKSIDVSVCGDMASNPDVVTSLLDLGIRDLSVSISQVAQIKHIVRQWEPSSIDDSGSQ